MNALLQLIPLAHKLIPDADKAREVAGKIHLAAINRINEYVYSALSLVVCGALMFQLYQVDNGLPINWFTFGVKFTLLMVLLGVKAGDVKAHWKLSQEIKKAAIRG